MSDVDDLIAALKVHHDVEGVGFYDIEEHICECNQSVCEADIALVNRVEGPVVETEGRTDEELSKPIDRTDVSRCSECGGWIATRFTFTPATPIEGKS